MVGLLLRPKSDPHPLVRLISTTKRRSAPPRRKTATPDNSPIKARPQPLHLPYSHRVLPRRRHHYRPPPNSSRGNPLTPVDICNWVRAPPQTSWHKNMVVVHNTSPEHLFDIHPAPFRPTLTANCDGLTILGASVGTGHYMTRNTSAKSNTVKRSLEILGKMPDAHVAYTLATACFGACSINHALRTTPNYNTQERAEIFDTAMENLARLQAGGVLSEQNSTNCSYPSKLKS